MLGVSTIGNAILIAYDDNPILATDPWFGDENPASTESGHLTTYREAAFKTSSQAIKRATVRRVTLGEQRR
jgi:hypothetical protein